MVNFYSHAPCGARPDTYGGGEAAESISTHTPHAGRDQAAITLFMAFIISTHTPHAGRDKEAALL